jgi:hypothetical protein
MAPEEYDAEELECFVEEDLVEALQRIEQYREKPDAAGAAFKHLLMNDAKLRECWHQFTQAGGLSSDEFDRFIKGRFRYRHTRQRNHLRCFSTRLLTVGD